MAVVLLSRFRRELIIAGLLAAFSLALLLPVPEGLKPEGWRVLCVFALCVVLWVTALLPMAITSLLAIASIPLLGILPEGEAYAFFGSKVVFFILGAFILAAAITASGLSTRLTLTTLRAFGKTPSRLAMGVFFVSALFSCFMSAHAVAAMMFPIVLAIAGTLGLAPRRSAYGRALFFALAWGCIVGGTATMLGGGRAPLGVGILERMTSGGTTIGFMEYVLMTLPLVLVLFVVCAVVNARGNRPEIDSVKPALVALEQRIREMGTLTMREMMVAGVMVITVLLWMTVGHRLGLANIAILATGALFALRLVSWPDLERTVNWAVILMYGGAICLGAAMDRSGAATWIAESVVGGVAGQPIYFLMGIAVLTTVLSEFMSNSAVVAVMMPAALGLGAAQGIDPVVCTMSVVLPCNFAFALPMATPVNAIAFSAGYWRPVTAVRFGVLLDLMGLLVFFFLLTVWWPLIGVQIS